MTQTRHQRPPGLPKNVKVGYLLITDLSQQMKAQRDFLKWMGRRYAPVNEEQSEAFFTGARLFDELRRELLAGDFDVYPPEEKDLFTGDDRPAAGSSSSSPKET